MCAVCAATIFYQSQGACFKPMSPGTRYDGTTPLGRALTCQSRMVQTTGHAGVLGLTSEGTSRLAKYIKRKRIGQT